ncbi:hypothetical protein DFH28DRAFT_912355 [Melampsora americana]|nr:hypothetical protein DFH28DRAFT_912355 [Melampsora americana]
MDWGLSDGEGMERIWSRLATLVSALRYSTKTHRLVAINLRGQHHNMTGRSNLVKWILKREKTAQKQYVESKVKLDQLKREPRYTEDYIIAQWNQQRECQLRTMRDENSTVLSQKLAKLVKLEETLRNARGVKVTMQKSKN